MDVAAPASGLRELRLALVCYGGVSLAIYMHGVTKEIHKLLLASAAYDEPTNPFPTSRSEYVYWDLLHRMERGEVGRSRGVVTRVVVDVISGTSAGGINGICLAKAVALNRSQDALKVLWFERGDIKQLAAAPKFLPLWVKTPLLLGKSAMGRQTPLRGDDMCRWLFGAFEEMDRTNSPYPGPPSLLPPGHALDLFVTATDFRGYPRELPIFDPRIVTDVAHRCVFEFHHENPTRTDFGPQTNHVWAFAARATSSFPGACPPITFKAYEDCFETDRPRLSDLAARQFRVYEVSDVDPGRSSFVDGGVLNNYPFALAVRAIKVKPAACEVVRRLLYIEPDPIPAKGRPTQSPTDETKRLEAEVPSWLGTIWGGLSTIPAAQPVIDDLNQLAERNRVVRRIRDIIEVSFERIRQHVVAAVRNAGLTPENVRGGLGGQQLVTIRAAVQAQAEGEAGFAYATYWRLRLRVVLKRYAAMIADCLDFPEDSYPARFIETVASDWAVSKRLLNQIEANKRVIEDSNGQASFLTDIDVDYQTRRIQFVIAAVNWWYRDLDQAGVPARAELDAAKVRLYQYLTDLDAKVVGIFKNAARDALDRAFPRDAVREAARQQDRTYATRKETDLDRLRTLVGDEVHRHVEQLEGSLYADLTRLTARWDQKVLVDLVVRYFGFPFWDVLVFPVQALHDVNERDHVEVVRISPYDATLLEADGDKKLKGTGFHHFAAFFRRDYRENDYLWGRLDAAERLIGLLLDDPNTPGIPADPAECRKVFAAILEDERLSLSTATELLQTLGLRNERIGK